MKKLIELLKAGEIIQAKQFIDDNRGKEQEIIEALLQHYEGDGYARKHRVYYQLDTEEVKGTSENGTPGFIQIKTEPAQPLDPVKRWSVGPHFPEKEGAPVNLTMERKKQKQTPGIE